jgi:hypothetical protein
MMKVTGRLLQDCARGAALRVLDCFASNTKSGNDSLEGMYRDYTAYDARESTSYAYAVLDRTGRYEVGTGPHIKAPPVDAENFLRSLPRRYLLRLEGQWRGPLTLCCALT